MNNIEEYYMSKYDFELELSQNTSTGIILNKIKPGSVVLEFGCATGRMTKYMKEVLNCQVYIVEYEKSAYDIAERYAVDGVCDDIMTLSWLKRFEGIKFDVILFVDILEHLTKPENVLNNVKKILKEDGNIYVSIPNITHNDVLLKLFYNDFEYTDVGLLDNTHVHFWGYNNIEPFAKKCGLQVIEIEATYCETGMTEQYSGRTIPVSQELLNNFKERQFGTVYQFIITLKNSLNCENIEKFEVNINGKQNIKSHIYYDEGEGFSEDNIIEFEAEATPDGRYIAHYVIFDLEKIKQIRFDPIEFQSCILESLSIRQMGKELDKVYSEYVEIDGGLLMLGEDPIVTVTPIYGTSAITIDADIIVAGSLFIEKLKEFCKSSKFKIDKLKKKYNNELELLYVENEDLKNNFNILNDETNVLNTVNQELRILYDGIVAEKEELLKENNKLDSVFNELKKEQDILLREYNEKETQIGNLSAERDRLQMNIDEYIKLVNNKDKLLILKNGLLAEREQQLSEKDKLILEKDNALSEKDRLILEKDNTLSEKDKLIWERDNVLSEKEKLILEMNQRIIELESRVAYYDNRFCVRVCNKFWRVYHRITKPFKRER